MTASLKELRKENKREMEAMAVFLVFLICAVLYRNLRKSQLAGKN